MSKINASFGDIIQNYQILKKIKSTSFETKYIANDIRINKKRTIRHINKSTNLEQTLREAIVYKRLTFDNLIQGVLDFFIENKELYIVMDYFDGDKTLANYVCTEIPFETVVKWSLDLAISLDYLHLHNQSHGKITVDNIFINENNRLVLGEMAFTHENETKCQESDIETLLNLLCEKFPQIRQQQLKFNGCSRDFLKDIIKQLKDIYLFWQ